MVVDVHRTEGAWLNVTVQGSRFGPRTGYVEAKFVRIQAPRPPPPPPPKETGPVAAQPQTPVAPPSPTTAPPAVDSPRPAPVTAPRPAPSASGPAQRLKKVKIRGYVTEVRSPTDFDIEDYRITRDTEFALVFENATPDITFQLQDIRVGIELQIEGFLNEQSSELKATSMRVDMEQFKSIKQTTFVSVAPEGIQLLNGGWAGELRADGQVIRVTAATVVVFKPTKREKALAKLRGKGGSTPEEEEREFELLKSLEQVTVGMAMTYEGKRDPDTGHILAERVEFASNDLEDGEARLWRSMNTSTRPPNGLKPGELKIGSRAKYKLLPNDEVQQYVAEIGRRLIPSYQAMMPADDPRKIPFQFHVVIDDGFNAFATANGIVIVNTGLLDLLDNEAQLAAIIGHEIAHATHEHTWRELGYRKKTRLGIALAGAVAAAYGHNDLADVATLVKGAIENGYSRSLENQSDRIGLQYMTAAGYDPREAPAVWKLVAKKNGVSVTDFFWSSHDNESTRRSYLMNELKNNYRDLDWASLRTNRERYSQIKESAAKASNTKRRLIVKP